MWDAQTADLLPHFRVLRPDTRGHGASSAPPGDYSIAELGRDVLAIADACGVQRFAFCGLSLGGMIGQWLAVHAPERLTDLVLANTTSAPDRSAADGGAPPRRPRRRNGGDRGSRDGPVLFAGRARVGDHRRLRRAADVACRPIPSATPAAARPSATWTRPDCCPASRSRRSSSAAISTSGCRGRVTRPSSARSIAGARAVRLPAAHISNLERPRSFTVGAPRFPAAGRRGHPRSQVCAVRRAVLGDALRRPRDRRHDRFHARLSGADHDLPVGSDLDAARAWTTARADCWC